MKLRNKKTGEKIDLDVANIKAQFGSISVIPEPAVLGSDEYVYNSLAELNEEWEDYEEPKQWYGLNAIRDVGFEPLEYEGFEDLYKHAKELGIAFETAEEAKLAVRKLKAWKRLKDKGFRFLCWNDDYTINFTIDGQNTEPINFDELSRDLCIVFSEAKNDKG